MNISLRQAGNFLCLAAFLTAGSSAFANTISGEVFCHMSGNVPASAPTSTPCATFTTTSLNFNEQSSNKNLYTLGGFFASDPGAVTNVTYGKGYSSTSGLDNTLFDFTGETYVTAGTKYFVTHDDGTIMYLNGVAVVNRPGPTPADTDYYTATTSGHAAFNFLYSEVDNAPAVYQTNLADASPVSPVPEPGSFVLLGSGVLAAAGAVRRRLSR